MSGSAASSPQGAAARFGQKSAPGSRDGSVRPVVVIPSIRDIVPERIAAIPEDVEILVVDDSDGKIKPTRKGMTVFTYADQRDVMGAEYDLIPHKTSACRNFAFYYVFRHTNHNLILTIDDDCVVPDNFLDAYSVVGTTGEWPNVEIDGWFNTIEYLGVRAANGTPLYPRGFPYWLRVPSPERRSTVTGRLACLMGMWNNVLDYNGLDRYVSAEYRALHPTARPEQPLLTIGTPQVPTKFAMCSMNFGFTRDLLVAAYQMPMDREIIPGYPIWRFEDIWSGYLIEALVHKRGGADVIAVGEPTVHHIKEGDLVREVHGEHFGHLLSPYFYALIDAGIEAIAPGTYVEMYCRLFTHLVDHFGPITDRALVPMAYRPYFLETFQRLERWGALFQSGDAAAATAGSGVA